MGRMVSAVATGEALGWTEAELAGIDSGVRSVRRWDATARDSIFLLPMMQPIHPFDFYTRKAIIASFKAKIGT